MNDATKDKITAAIDALAARGVKADRLALHPETARELGVTATHLDWSSPATHPSADEIAAELTHADYDRNPARDDLGRPKKPEEAAALAAPRCGKHRRRAVALAVALDEGVERGKFRVTGTQTVAHAEET